MCKEYENMVNKIANTELSIIGGRLIPIRRGDKYLYYQEYCTFSLLLGTILLQIPWILDLSTFRESYEG